ncbi:hypothetical protein [Rhizobium sp. 9140]|uniref:hypothetical protein n=1 Tax=Rhizobium sp. 9140 TaxID=1761900 RepID=UPI000791DDAA|nr:hypothetical protein [Rhizobium sp. 9140]CZT36519.1 hypothetical protein GA0004734_00035150 [Rhizobium sp. 9140]
MSGGKAADEQMAFEQAFARLPSGYIEGAFEGRPWGAIVRRSTDHRRVWLFARDLRGNDIVSFNLYRTASGGAVLKPCEMSSDKVTAFVIGFKPAVE